MDLSIIKSRLNSLCNYFKDNFKAGVDINIDTPIGNDVFHVDTTQVADYISNQIEKKKRNDAVCPIYFFDNDSIEDKKEIK